MKALIRTRLKPNTSKFGSILNTFGIPYKGLNAKGDLQGKTGVQKIKVKL